MKKIRLGLVGCGRISEFHLKALHTLPDFYEVVAVADTALDRAQNLADQYHFRAHSSLEALLANEKLDLVTLATPSGLHPSQALQCAQAGVGCVSEKPLGCFYDEAEKVVREFEKRNLPLFVVHQNRWNPTVQKVRKFFDSGEMGKLYLIQANVFWQRPQSYYDAEPWRGRRDLDGGAFMNQASHYLDLLQWFGGPLDRVTSELDTFGRKIECEDTGAAVIRFQSGAIGVVSVSMLTYPENLEGSLTFIAEHATLKIGGKALNQFEVCRAKNQAYFIEAEKENYEPKTVYGNGHQEYYKKLYTHFHNSGHPEAVTGREGLKSLKLITEIYRKRDGL